MRLVRTALIVSAVFMAAPLAQAQVAHSDVHYGCSSCPADCQCESCCGCGILSGLTAKLGQCVGGLLGGHIGCDGRHGVYKAALCRNSFDKKYQLPIAYYRHLLPMYRHNRCCCGPHTPVEHCPTCGPESGMMGEEYIEMQEVPQPTPAEPTQAAHHGSRPAVPGAVVPARRVTEDRMASAAAAEPEAPQVRPASAVQRAKTPSRVANPLR